MNITETIIQSKKLVAESDYEKAILLLSSNFYGKYPDIDIDDALILLASRLNKLKKDIIYGIIDYGTEVIQINTINRAIVLLIKDIEYKFENTKLNLTVNIDNLKNNYPDWNSVVEQENDEQEQQKYVQEGMEEIKKLLSTFIPQLKDFTGDFHEKLISQVRDENVFKIEPKRVFVFGESNAGKTTTINNLLKSDIFDTELFPASDKYNLTQTLNCGEHEGGLVIYDSPGIGGAEITENLTRVALSISQKEKNKAETIIVLDATKDKKEGSDKFRELPESEILKYLNEKSYFEHKDSVIGKEYKVFDFQYWVKSKFDFYVFVVPCGWGKGLHDRQIDFLKDFYHAVGNETKVFKIFNISNDRKHSRYTENYDEFDTDIKFAHENSVEEFKLNNFPYPEDWIFVESNFAKGFDKVIESMVKSLSADTLIKIEKSIKTDYSHLIHSKLDEFYFKYVSFIASIAGCYPVDFYVEKDTLLSYSLKSIFIVSEYIYQDSKNVDRNILDSFIKKIKRDRKDYKDISYYKTITENKRVYSGTGVPALDEIRGIFGYANYIDVPEKKKVLQSDEKKFYRIGGQLAITLTLAIGIALHEIYRGKRNFSESEFLAKINQLHGQISKEFTPLDIPEKLRKYKHSELRKTKIQEIQPKIENYVKEYLHNLK